MVLVVTAKDGDGWHKGKAVQRGGTIGIVAPATHGDDLPVQAYIDVLHHLGYKTKVGPHAMERYGYFAGTDAERADDVNAFFLDDSVDAILCLNGGYGSARILDYLDYDMIRRHPKQLIGFSDITALETALYEKPISRRSTGLYSLPFQRGTLILWTNLHEALRQRNRSEK